MLRKIGAVVLGYVCMFAFVFVGLTATWTLLGADRAFLPGLYEVTTAWIAASLVVGICAALLGGVVTRLVSGGTGAVIALAVLVFVLGIIMVIPTLGPPADAVVRTGAPGMFEAMQFARTPPWVGFANAVIGAVGALAGGGVLRSAGRQAAATSPAVQS